MPLAPRGLLQPPPQPQAPVEPGLFGAQPQGLLGSPLQQPREVQAQGPQGPGGLDEILRDRAAQARHRQELIRGWGGLSPEEVEVAMGPFAMGGAGVGAVRGTRVLAPALRLKGQTYIGDTHKQALGHAIKEIGDDARNVVKNTKVWNMARGFVTEKGEFISARDAAYLSLDKLPPHLQPIVQKSLMQADDMGPVFTAELIPGRWAGLREAAKSGKYKVSPNISAGR